MDDSTTKTCTRCKQAKPTDQFAIDKRLKNGRVSRCKACVVELHRERRKADPEFRAYGYRYQQERRQRDPEYNERWLAYKRRKSQEWKEQHPEDTQKRAQRNAQRRSTDPALRAKYTDYERTRRQERQRADPAFHEHLMDLAKRGWHKRRARLAASGGSYTRSEWRRLCDYYDHRCVCCGKQLQRLTVDHVIPLSKGGRNTISNLQPLCRSCNSKKHDKAIDYRTTLPPWMESDQ